MNADKNILVVDDDSGYRGLIDKELRAAGYDTVLAQNGGEALVALWEKDSIGLVILDMRLPAINGLNIFEIIRKDFSNKKIIATSMFQKDEQQSSVYAADDHYDKSENLSRLIEKVNNLINGSMQMASKENEKRNFRRIPANAIASCESGSHYGSDTCTHFISYAKDLSLCGGKFIVNEKIKVGQHLTIALELPVNSFPILIDCEVVWVRKSEAGIRFIKLDSAHDEKQLKDYLHHV